MYCEHFFATALDKGYFDKAHLKERFYLDSHCQKITILDMLLEAGRHKKIKNLQPSQTIHIPQILACKQIKYSPLDPKSYGVDFSEDFNLTE